MNGFLNMLKPPGMTSAAVVAAVRRMTGEKRVGHAGTLDPEAAGVLPVMVGQAARLFDYLTEKEKIYVTECAFGYATDTQDAQGRVTSMRTGMPDISAVRAAAEQLTGDIWQRPSAYSALKRDGKKLCDLARQGVVTEIEPRKIHIERIEVGYQPHPDSVMLKVVCGRGTYIRALCEDLGRICGFPAHMRFLLRAASGCFTLDNAVTLEEAGSMAESGALSGALIPCDAPLQSMQRVDVPQSMAKLAINGTRIPWKALNGPSQISEQELVRVYLDGVFLGIGTCAAHELTWRMRLNT